MSVLIGGPNGRRAFMLKSIHWRKSKIHEFVSLLASKDSKLQQTSQLFT